MPTITVPIPDDLDPPDPVSVEEERAAARRRYAEAVADLHLAGRPLELADTVRPDDDDATLTAALRDVADALAATPDDTTATETVLRAGEGERRKARARRAARVKKVRDALATLGITLADLRVALDARDDDEP